MPTLKERISQAIAQGTRDRKDMFDRQSSFDLRKRQLAEKLAADMLSNIEYKVREAVACKESTVLVYEWTGTNVDTINNPMRTAFRIAEEQLKEAGYCAKADEHQNIDSGNGFGDDRYIDTTLKLFLYLKP